MSVIATCPVRAVLPLDVVERGGMARRISVRVEGAIPVVRDDLPVVASVRLAGSLTMCGGEWPRGPELPVDYAGREGRTYAKVLLPYGLEPDDLHPRDGISLLGKEVAITGMMSVDSPYHAATGRREAEPDGQPALAWTTDLAERYDLTWAAPVVASFRRGAADNLLFAGGRLYKSAPLPRWWANASGNEISLEDRRMTTADRDADIFDVDRLEDARRYMALVTRGRQGPFRVVGGVDRVDTAYLDGARNDLCATIAPWIANRYARYLADLPGDLVRHAHDAANYVTDGLVDRGSLLPALCELLRRSGTLPPTRRGEFPESAVQALLVRLHGVEGVPGYGEWPQDSTLRP